MLNYKLLKNGFILNKNKDKMVKCSKIMMDFNHL
jgi:hypothetical protein